MLSLFSFKHLNVYLEPVTKPKTLKYQDKDLHFYLDINEDT